MPIISTRIDTPMYGREALEAVRHGEGAIALRGGGVFSQPLEEDISLERAEQLIALEPAFVGMTAEIAYFGTNKETYAVCGDLMMAVDPPEQMMQSALERLSRGGVENLSQVDLGDDLLGFQKIAVDGLVAFLREVGR